MSSEYKDFLKKKFFGKKYSRDYDRWVEDPFTAFVERRQNKGFLELSKAKPGMKVLDIGAGTGKYEILYSRLMQKKGIVVALDFSDSMLSQIRKNIKKHKLEGFVFLVKGDGEHLPFKQGAFDEVLTMNTLQYIPNDRKFLAEINRVLKNGGNAVIDAISLTELRLGHNLALFWDKARKAFGKKPLGVYRQFYTNESIKHRIQEHGLKVKKQIGVILVLPWITKEHVGVTLPSPHHIFTLFPKLFPIMEKVEEKIKNIPLLQGLCTHLMVQAGKK